LQEGAAAAMGGGTDPFKLPIIARGTGAHQAGKDLENIAAFGSPMNQQAQANAATHHHLNVTLGEEKFYYSANDNNPGSSRLPNITNQSGSSSRLRTHLGNEYIGLMSKKNKDRLGSMDFNVQNSFAVGGPAFNIQEARAEAREAAGPNDMGHEVRMTTIEPVVATRLQGLQDSDTRRSRGSRGSSRFKTNNKQGLIQHGSASAGNNQKQIQALQTNADEADFRKISDTP
jgi:hypothetical protein